MIWFINLLLKLNCMSLGNDDDVEYIEDELNNKL
jgi:hypothetical protein